MKLTKGLLTSFPVLFFVAVLLPLTAEGSPLSLVSPEPTPASIILAQANSGGAPLGGGNSGTSLGGGNSQGNPNSGGGLGINNPLKYTDLQSFLYALLDLVLLFGYIIAVFFIIYSGFLFVVAQGNEEKINNARFTLLWTVIGTAVLIGAKVIAETVQATINSLGA